MQKRIIIFFLLLFPLFGNAQNFLIDFEDVPTLFTSGWVHTNNSSPLGSGDWRQDNGNFTAHAGTANSSIVVGFNSIQLGQSGDISNWLITPTINFTAGDSIIFYTISYANSSFPDRLEVRLNINNTTDVGTTTSSVGDFDSLLFTINPTLTIASGGYPMIWARYATVIPGSAAATPCRIGLRYFVTDGGQTGANSSTIGIDNFEYKSVFTGVENNASLLAYVQLLNGQLQIAVPEASHAFSVELLDIAGKILHSSNYDKTASIEMGNYSSGVYLVKIVYEGKYLIKKISF